MASMNDVGSQEWAQGNFTGANRHPDARVNQLMALAIDGSHDITTLAQGTRIPGMQQSGISSAISLG